jgi:hypothetical protein|tara:strand:- start:540 stop:758 length:219 start_codon:yes stop_codon:yes gene_type:complete
MTKNKNRVYKVENKYRKNELSFTEGGETVVVRYKYFTKEYTNIKYPSAFIKKIEENNTDNDLIEIFTKKQSN